jgi:methionine-rich copper-binding protein CopC
MLGLVPDANAAEPQPALIRLDRLRRFLLPKAKLFILLAALAVAGTLSLGQSQLALAHSRPARFDPSPGSVLDAAPADVTGWFTEDLRRDPNSFIQVLVDNGATVSTGDTTIAPDRRQMTINLQSGLGEGRYIVYWSSLDDGDGDVFSGCYGFFVGQAAADNAVTNSESLDAGADCPAVPEAAETTTPDTMASNATLDIGVAVKGSDATITMQPADFTPRAPDGSTEDPNFGHYHIYLDKVPDDVLTGSHMDMPASADGTPTADSTSVDQMSDSGTAENPVMWVENSYTFTDLAPGVHTVSVALFHDDHTPLSPPVIASQTFTVGGAGGSDSGGVATWVLAIGIIGGLVVGGAGMKLAGNRA